MAGEPRSCTNEDCRFAVDGKCVEGYPLGECPHLSQLSVEDIGVVEEKTTSQPLVDMVSLSPGEALGRVEASSLQRRRLSRTIGVVGPNDAGKTSLLAGVYDLLQSGPVADVAFAGSATLIGFEKVCHDARAASRRDSPHTERTSAGADATFFHLDLLSPDTGLVSVFIGDRSGEDYLAASDDLSRADEFFELRRADSVTLLVNGDHLTVSEHRHEAKAATLQVVDALVEAGAMRPGCRLAVVLTKEDAVLASPHADRVHHDFNALLDAVVQRHGDYLGEINSYIVAASPKDSSKIKRGHGVDQLLLFWLHAATPPRVLAEQITESSRMIDLLGRREVPQ